MPPRVRKRKAEDPEEPPKPEQDDKKRVKVDLGEQLPQNTSGLLALPVELFDKIYENLLGEAQLITREDVLDNKPHLDETFVYRTDVLRALTQTCHALRASCLPKYYEHVEACVVRGSRVWYKQLAERLESTSRMLVECPHLAEHVRVVTVSLTRTSTESVLPAFAACLKALPNLHTLRVMHAHSQMTTALKNAFEKVNLPQIRTLILPTCAHNILRACPNAMDVTCNEGDGSQLISAMAKAAPNVEVVDRICLWNDATAKRLARAAPEVRELRVSLVDKLLPFLKRKNLAKIRITTNVQSDKAEDRAHDLAVALEGSSTYVDVAKTVVASSAVKSGKTVEVVFKVRDFEREAAAREKKPYEHEYFYKVGKTVEYPAPSELYTLR